MNIVKTTPHHTLSLQISPALEVQLWHNLARLNRTFQQNRTNEIKAIIDFFKGLKLPSERKRKTSKSKTKLPRPAVKSNRKRAGEQLQLF